MNNIQAVVEQIVKSLELRAREIEAADPQGHCPPEFQRLCEARAMGIRDAIPGLRAAFAAGLRDGAHAVELAFKATQVPCGICGNADCPDPTDHTGRVVLTTRFMRG